MSQILTTFDGSGNKDLFKGVLRKLFDNTERTAMVEYPNIFNEVDTSDDFERDMRIAGLSDAAAVPEGEAIPIQSPKSGVTKTYTQASYGTGFRITDRMKRFNKYSLMAKWTKDLGKVMRETKDKQIATLLNNPTSTSAGGTGFESTKPLASATQLTLDDAATGYDNIISTSGAALSTSSLESALYYFDTLVDDQGEPMTASPTALIVCPNLRVTANELLRSDNKAHEMSNTINVYPDWDVKIFIYHRYSGTTAWSMIAKNDENYDINVLTSMQPDIRIEAATDGTRDTIVSSLQYFTWGFGDPRLFVLGNT